ncbi:MAG: hypothetical protein ACKV22_34295 [Bryobacteraceae bacterium]
MNRTRLSLFYVAGYLTFAGVGLLLAPRMLLKLMLSNGDYGEAFPRFAGSLMLALAIVVLRLIQKRAVDLYPTTIQIRALIAATISWLYADTRDPFFLVVLGVVGAGMVFTGYSLWKDRQNS